MGRYGPINEFKIVAKYINVPCSFSVRFITLFFCVFFVRSLKFPSFSLDDFRPASLGSVGALGTRPPFLQSWRFPGTPYVPLILFAISGVGLVPPCTDFFSFTGGFFLNPFCTQTRHSPVQPQEPLCLTPYWAARGICPSCVKLTSFFWVGVFSTRAALISTLPLYSLPTRQGDNPRDPADPNVFFFFIGTLRPMSVVL